MRAMAVVLTLALWLAAGATFARAQGPNDALVNGSVSDAVSGAPIAGAVVSATGSLGDSYKTTTDGLGEFAFDDVVAPESYTLEYEAAGYQRVTTSRSWSRSTQIMLPPEPSAKKLASGALGTVARPLLSHQR